MRSFLTGCLIILLTLGCSIVLAQQGLKAENDSLLKQLPLLKDDTNKVKVLNVLSQNDAYMNAQEGLRFGQQCIDLARKLKWDEGMADGYNAVGLNYQNVAEHSTALEYYQQAMKIYEATRNKKGLARTLSLMAVVHQSQSEYSTALELYMKKLKINEEINDKRGIARSIFSLGLVYAQMGDTAKALEFDQQALKMLQDEGDKFDVAGLMMNMGNVYETMHDYTKALNYYFRNLEMNQTIGNKKGIARVTGNIGSVYGRMRNYRQAIDYMQRSIKLLEELGDKKGLDDVLYSFGECYMRWVTDTSAGHKKAGNKTALLRKGTDCLERSLALSVQIHSSVRTMDCYHTLEEAYKLSGNYKKAVGCADNYTAVKDSVFSKEKDEKMLKMLMTYDFEKKELAEKDAQEKKDILVKAEIIKEKNQKRWLIAGAVVLLFVAAGAVYFLYYTRKSKRAIELLMKEIHHRVKNNLQVITTLLQLQLKTLTDESAILSIEDGISRINSITLIHRHLYMAQHLNAIEFSGFARELLMQISSVCRKPGQIIDQQNDIPETWFEIESALPLGLILNELMTNSYKYAFNDTTYVKLILSLTLKGNDYNLAYCDSGPGMPAGYEVESSDSLGMTIINNLSKQLDGSFSYRKDDNCFIVRFLKYPQAHKYSIE